MSLVVAEGLSARVGKDAVLSSSFALGAGAHALLGSSADGVLVALAVLAGAARARRGRVRVLDRDPTDARARRTSAYVPREVAWPDALRVDDAFALAARIRAGGAGGPARAVVTRVLARFGLEALAPRLGRTLAPEELRAVALAEAVSAEHVRVILVEEPRVLVDARASGPLLEALAARARAGACVVMATASTRDAGELCDGYVLFTRGSAVRHALATEPAAIRTASHVRVVASDARALLARLASSREVTSLAFRGDALRVGAADERTAAAAVARAAIAAGVEIRDLRPDAPSLQELRATLEGDAAGAFRAAEQRTQRALSSAPPVGLPAQSAPPPSPDVPS